MKWDSVFLYFLLVLAIHCWRCSSDSSNGEFCNDPFDPSVVSDVQKTWTYVECSYQPANQRAVCKKTKQIGKCYIEEIWRRKKNEIMMIAIYSLPSSKVNDTLVVSRSCFWEKLDADKNDCLNLYTPSHIKTTFCETCSTDGCNGDAMNPVDGNWNSFFGKTNAPKVKTTTINMSLN